jgi:hypothetical protein
LVGCGESTAHLDVAALNRPMRPLMCATFPTTRRQSILMWTTTSKQRLFSARNTRRIGGACQPAETPYARQ